MKLLLITSLKEHGKTVHQLVSQAGIKVFSMTEIVGYKDDHDPDLMDSWFSHGEEHVDSIMLFSFTTSEKADQALKQIQEHNRQHDTGFPIRVFILPVDKASHTVNA
jgi:nitrogen regulatory protein PII